MKFFSIFFLIIFTFFNFSFAEDKKTTGQELEALGATDLQLCKVVCESEYSKCYDDDKKNASPCASKVSTCKKKCENETKK
jgi:hypothetical protein